MMQVKIALTKRQQKELKELFEIADNAKRLGMIIAQVKGAHFLATFVESGTAEQIIKLARPDRPIAKPCPFCGDEPNIYNMTSGNPLVFCANKDCFMYHIDPTHVDDWNNRKVKA